jgi:hypothetical protein
MAQYVCGFAEKMERAVFQPNSHHSFKSVAHSGR